MSKKRLSHAHPDLQEVVSLAIKKTKVDFGVGETARSMTRQKALKDAGASKTMNSRHLLKTPKNNPELGEVAHAVDLYAWVDGRVSWDWPLYHQIAAAMFEAANELGIDLEWGGNWKSFKDGPHFELSWKSYPVE